MTRGNRREYRDLTAERDALKAALVAEKVGGHVIRSRFIAEMIAVPDDIMQSKFGDAFAIEDGRLVAKDASGNRILSRSRMVEQRTLTRRLRSSLRRIRTARAS